MEKTQPSHSVSLKLSGADENGDEHIAFKQVGTGWTNDKGNVTIKISINEKTYTLYVNKTHPRVR